MKKNFNQVGIISWHALLWTCLKGDYFLHRKVSFIMKTAGWEWYSFSAFLSSLKSLLSLKTFKWEIVLSFDISLLIHLALDIRLKLMPAFRT